MKNPYVITPLILVALSGIYFLSHWKPGAELSNRELVFTCTTDMATEFHIHPVLTILVDGQPVPIPVNIGIEKGCMHPLHTHTPDGTIHVESPEKRDFTLGDFFAVWGQTLIKDQIFDRTVDEQHTLTMTINGQPVDTFENTILKDMDQILITYSLIAR